MATPTWEIRHQHENEETSIICLLKPHQMKTYIRYSVARYGAASYLTLRYIRAHTYITLEYIHTLCFIITYCTVFGVLAHVLSCYQ